MPDPPPGGEPGSGATSEPLIFVSDASAEAERLTSTLRSRGYVTVDVPLGLLVGRVAVQRPSLVLCDVDAIGSLDAIERMRELPGGGTIDVLFLGEAGRTLDDQQDRITRQSSGIFVRPVDVYAMLRKVEALIGQPDAPMGRPSAPPQAHRVPVLVAATRRPYRYDTRARARNFPTLTAAQAALAAPSAAAVRVTQTPAPMTAPDPELLPSQTPGTISSDLAALLGRAEQRVLGSRTPLGSGERLSPEAELEAVLPEDLLAALDEPLDELDDEDDDDQGTPGTPGTHGSDSNLSTRGGSRPGQDSTAGTSPGGSSMGSNAARETTTSGGDRGEPASERADQLDAAPPTPPAVPRTVPPSRTRSGQDTTGFSSIPPATSAESLFPPAPVELAAPAEDVPPATPPQVSTKPPRGRDVTEAPRAREVTESPQQVQQPPPLPAVDIEIPSTLRAGDAVRVLARAVRARYLGALAFEDTAGIRRIVFRDGDFVIAASGIDGESLVAFLTQRGDLAPEAAARIGRKLPQFGRHAGAALIAQGHLRQEDLWPTLRTHAEWIITRIATLGRGGVSLERQVSPRLAAEPSVFGGATGAEVLIEVVRRAVTPSDALGWLGGTDAQLVAGEAETLLAECALGDFELDLVRTAAGRTVGELMERAQVEVPELPNVLFTLVELGVLRTRSNAPAAGARRQRRPVKPDIIDHEAVRARIQARRALVEEGDYFALLGVSRNATGYDIRRAYSSLRQEFEPGNILTPLTADLGEDLGLVLEMLDEAYEILRDEIRRDRYRRALEDAG